MLCEILKKNYEKNKGYKVLKQRRCFFALQFYIIFMKKKHYGKIVYLESFRSRYGKLK